MVVSCAPILGSGRLTAISSSAEEASTVRNPSFQRVDAMPLPFNFWKCLEKRSDGRLKFHRSSPLTSEDKSDVSKSQKYQNTFRLDSSKPFKIDAVDKIVKTVMMNRLEDETYDSDKAPNLCSQVASEIRKKILKLDYERYKIVVAVTIIEKASQSLETNMGFVWDAERDNYSTYTFETETFFAYCLVTGTYYE